MFGIMIVDSAIVETLGKQFPRVLRPVFSFHNIFQTHINILYQLQYILTSY